MFRTFARHPRSAACYPLLGAALLFLTSEGSHADIKNPQFLPIGERAAFLGNTGTGANKQTEGVYYNPATIADLLENEISVTGSVYFQFKVGIDPILSIDGTDIPYEAKGFNTIPSTLVSTMKLGGTVVAISTLVPDSIQTETNSHFETQNYYGVLMPFSSTSDLWIGASVAERFSPKWSVGLSLFLSLHDESKITSVGYVKTDNTEAFNSHERLVLSTVGVVPVFGVHYTASDQLQLGLRLRAPLIPITGAASAEKLVTFNQVKSDADSYAITETKANYRLPVDITLGTVFSPSVDLDLLLDVGYQLGSRYSPVPALPEGEDVHTVPTLRFHAGAEVRLIRKLPFRIGGFYSPSTLAKINREIQSDVVGVTGGINLQSGKHVKTGLGGFFIFGEGEREVDGKRSQLNVRGRGVLLTTSYLF